MIGGIMAGGAGSRLSIVGGAKPLVEVAGESLLDRTCRQLLDAGSRRIVVECGADQVDVLQAAEQIGAVLGIEVRGVHAPVRGGTGSSVRAILKAVGEHEDALISTVDTVAPAGAYRDLVNSAKSFGAEAAVLATHHVQDEHPIYVQAESCGGEYVRVRDIGKQLPPSDLCFGNVRWLSPEARRSILRLPVRLPESDLAFLRQIGTDLGLYALIVDPVFDIDDPGDLASAEAWLSGSQS